MSILIKGMEMPKNCKDCQLLAWNGGYYCTANRTNIEVLRIKSRCDDCPLVELPFAEELAEKLYKQIEKAVIEGSET